MERDIKYRFALDSNENVIDIRFLSKETAKLQKYYTIDFHQELTPKLGEINAHHFALKPASNSLGTRETYLHALGKKVFMEEYADSLKNNTPFYIEYTTKPICSRLASKFGFKCKLDWKDELFDLTTVFDKIVEEKRDDGFVPDILLTAKNGKDKIYIEIAVTHLLSDKKRESNKRIIEIQLSEDSDVDSIRKLKKGDSPWNIYYYGFKSKTINLPDCDAGKCKKEFFQFSVKNNGKSFMVIEKESGLKLTNPAGVLHSRIQPSEPEDDHAFMFKYFVAKAHSEKVPIRNCFICKYSADNSSLEEGSPPIFCKFHKKAGNSNMASDCSIYRAHQPYINSYIDYHE
jgi:hypothetical protein